MEEPWFWRDDGIAAQLTAKALSPLSWAYAQGAALRQKLTKSWQAPVPVVCIGNASVGGVGKTPFAIMMARALQDKGYTPHFLTRGYGGAIRSPTRVNTSTHTHHLVGDEALLLAAVAPTWVSRTKRDGAKAAATGGADLIILDDGFQNPTIKKDYACLLVTADQLSKPLQIFPAGPMRESIAQALKRANAVIEITPAPAPSSTSPHVGYTAWLEPSSQIDTSKVYGFCGIGNPERFRETLEQTGAELIGFAAYPDHYDYRREDIVALQNQAKRLNATLITTEKDWVRLSPKERRDIKNLPITMNLSMPEQFLSSVIDVIEQPREDAA